MNKRSTALLAKLLLVILAVGMPLSIFAAAAAPTSKIDAPCEETPSPIEASESQIEEAETAHSPFCVLRAPQGEAEFVSAPRAPGHGERDKPPLQPPNSAAPR